MFLGVLSVYYRTPTLPLERDKYLLSQVARKIAGYIEQLNAIASRVSFRRVK